MAYNDVAAKWWADKLRNIGPGNFNNGDDSLAGGIAMILGSLIAMESEPSSKSIDLFEQNLADTIKEHVESSGPLILSVDYGPDALLGKIALKSGVNTNGFPWRTTMWIETEKVSVCAGYGAPTKIIFPESSE